MCTLETPHVASGNVMNVRTCALEIMHNNIFSPLLRLFHVCSLFYDRRTMDDPNFQVRYQSKKLCISKDSRMRMSIFTRAKGIHKRGLRLLKI